MVFRCLHTYAHIHCTTGRFLLQAIFICNGVDPWGGYAARVCVGGGGKGKTSKEHTHAWRITARLEFHTQIWNRLHSIVPCLFCIRISVPDFVLIKANNYNIRSLRKRVYMCTPTWCVRFVARALAGQLYYIYIQRVI